MYPHEELTRLAAVKAVLQQRSGRHRAETVGHARRASRPLHWIDRAQGYWRRIAPVARIAAGPAGILLLRFLSGRKQGASRIMRWAPTIWGLVRGFGSARARAADA